MACISSSMIQTPVWRQPSQFWQGRIASPSRTTFSVLAHASLAPARASSMRTSLFPPRRGLPARPKTERVVNVLYYPLQEGPVAMGLVPVAAEEGDIPFGCQPQESGEEWLLPGNLGSIAPGELLPGQPSPPPILQEGEAGAQPFLPAVHPLPGDSPGPFA